MISLFVSSFIYTFSQELLRTIKIHKMLFKLFWENSHHSQLYTQGPATIVNYCVNVASYNSKESSSCVRRVPRATSSHSLYSEEYINLYNGSDSLTISHLEWPLFYLMLCHLKILLCLYFSLNSVSILIQNIDLCSI